MSVQLDSFAAANAFALTPPRTERRSRYGKPAARIAVNGRTVLSRRRDAETSLAVVTDPDTMDLLKETEPQPYWQSRQWEGGPAALTCHDSPDPERVRDLVRQAHIDPAASKPRRQRKR
jgi:hypothetical protein